jgi:thiosulfate/3-mercaptopyruvate sulfurtransferase
MHQTSISVQKLDENLPNFRILDCRAQLGDLESGRRAYAAGHLPTALHADLDRDFAAAPGDGGRHPLPEPEALAAQLRAWGINDTDLVVTYDDAGGAFAARVWWCLRWLGHPAVAVLDGGLGAWTGTMTREVPEFAPGDFSIRPSLTRTISATGLLDIVEQRSPTARTDLLDARSQERFNGEHEPIDPVAGHIPGARCMPFQGNLDSSGHFKSAAELAQRFANLPADTICYCGSGVTAAHNVLAMIIARCPEPILYPGSWSEWITDPSRPRSPLVPEAGI